MSEEAASPITPLATPEELNDLRARVLAGEEFPAEEYRRIIQSYRAHRGGAIAAAAPKAKAKAATSKAATAVPLATLMAGLGL